MKTVALFIVAAAIGGAIGLYLSMEDKKARVACEARGGTLLSGACVKVERI